MNQEIKIGFDSIREMKVSDVLRIEEDLRNHTQEIGRRKK